MVQIDGELEPPLVNLQCADRTRFVANTNAAVFEMVDNLEHTAHNSTPAVLKRQQQRYGMNYTRNGIMYNRALRDTGIYKPVDHCIRDWMHTLANAGLANVHIGLLIHVLVAYGISVQMISDHVMEYTLPKKYGKVQRTWITENRLKDDNLSSFAGTILALVPILLCFLKETIEPMGILAGHILCFSLLNDIIDICRLGADKAMAHIDRLARVIAMHAEMFVELYPGAAKPKFHHLFHVIDNMRWLGKLLSCFVTERKHRSSKKAALHVFRHMEHTVLSDMVNQMCEVMADGALFTKTWLLNAQRYTVQDSALHMSRGALLECGEVKEGDIVWLISDFVGRVHSFWRQDNSPQVFIQIQIMDRILEDGTVYFTEFTHVMHFAEAAHVLDACIWIYKRPGVLKVLAPFAARLAA